MEINKSRKKWGWGGGVKSHLGFGADVEEMSLFIATNKSIKIPNLDCSFFCHFPFYLPDFSFLFFFLMEI